MGDWRVFLISLVCFLTSLVYFLTSNSNFGRGGKAEKRYNERYSIGKRSDRGDRMAAAF